jgi:hypothetical protein
MFGSLHVNEEPREVNDASGVGVTELNAARGLEQHCWLLIWA